MKINPYKGIVSEDLKRRVRFDQNGALNYTYLNKDVAKEDGLVSMEELLDIARKVIKIEMGLEGKTYS